MRIIIRYKQTGLSVMIDNSSQKNGEIRITGDEPLRSSFDRELNHETAIKYTNMIPYLKKELPNGCIINDKGIMEIYKASDIYLKDYFIPKLCKLHGYEVISNDFNG